MSVANNERRQVLPSKVIWDGTIDRFEVFRNNIEGNYGYVDFLDEIPSASQITKDARALYGALLAVCQSGVGIRI
jgi:hypothetical protein